MNRSMGKLFRHMIPYTFLLPFLLMYAAFSLFPLLYTLFMSFTDWNLLSKGSKFVGVDNYLQIFSGGAFFWKTLSNIGIMAAVWIPLILGGGLLLAVLLNSIFTRWKSFFQVTILLPYIIIPVAIGLVFSIVFDYSMGFANKFLMGLGLISENMYWLGTPGLARAVVILMVVWKYLGYNMTMFLAGIVSIPVELNEAAYIDGANAWQTFTRITVPMVKPIFVFLLLTGISGSFQITEEPMLLFKGVAGGITGLIGGPDRSCLTPVWNVYDTAFGSTSRFGLASALSYSTFLLILAVSSVSYLVLRKGEES